jgi:TDG/mug DNA glycosylase family protein
VSGVAQGLPDVIGPGLRVLLCGINPGLLAADTGHHFAGRGNRFWQVMHEAGFTPHRLAPHDSHTLLDYDCGLTTMVARATSREDQIAPEEYRLAAERFAGRIVPHAPAYVAFLGKPAWAAFCGHRQIDWGLQPARIGPSKVWVLPNPSGRNRAFSLERLVVAYRALHRAAFPPEV